MYMMESCSCGILVNGIAIMMTKLSGALHNAFGVITMGYCLSNLVILVVIGTWTIIVLTLCTLIDFVSKSLVTVYFSGNIWPDSPLQYVAGQVSNGMYYASITVHLLLAINRLCAICFPSKYARLFSFENAVTSLVFLMMVTFCISFTYYIDGCGYIFTTDKFVWRFEDTQCGYIISVYADFYFPLGVVVLMTIVDICTLFMLHSSAKRANRAGIATVSQHSSRTRNREILFFLQSCTCGSVYVLGVISFHVLSTFVTSTKWGEFGCVTFAWILVHSLDGEYFRLFVVLFTLYRRQHGKTLPVAPLINGAVTPLNGQPARVT
ncbi:unnamed protein product [Anisakis simplex]|uniref:7TM_GPCR_Srx domain-containing protein n=1 Tax=Anisakis simplex TaxID=6269 RepID=A0A0M3KCM5_ANISI|nr:unnamed protein product [Anisakis simplex]